MKIAIFSDTFLHQVNGVARSVYNSALMMHRLGHQVAVFTVTVNGESDEEIARGRFQIIRVPSMPMPGYPDQRVTIPPFSSVFAKVQEFDPDIIHAHTPFALGREAASASKKLGKPFIGTHHTFFDHYLRHIKLDYDWFKKPSWKFVVRYYNQCDLVLVLSQSLNRELVHHGLRKPTQVFSNAVDTNFFKPSSSLNPVTCNLIYMGRVSYEKSIDQVLRAFQLIIKMKPEATLKIVGDGPERQKLESLSEQLGLTDKLTFAGMMTGPSLVTTLQAADIFITASKSENQPLSILEAMACGLPIVGVDALGVPEVVKNEVNGFIVAPDDVAALAERALELLNNENLRQQFAMQSRELSLNYSEDKVGKKLEKIYQQLIQST